MDMSMFLGEFREEARAHLDVLQTRVRQLRPGVFDADAVRAMALSAHTIKGGAATMGLGDVAELAQAVEISTRQLRDHQLPPDGPRLAELDRALKLLGSLIERSAPGSMPDDVVRSLAEGLRRGATGGGSTPETGRRPQG